MYHTLNLPAWDHPQFLENLPDFPEPVANIDLELATATLASEATGTITPLVKEEIRYKIQRKRRTSGLDELQVDHKEQGPEMLTPRDIVRRERRKESNRLAAQRCRKKKKLQSDQLNQEMGRLEKENTDLVSQVAQLRQEKMDLERAFKEHMEVCTSVVHHLPPTPSPEMAVGCVDIDAEFYAFTQL